MLIKEQRSWSYVNKVDMIARFFVWNIHRMNTGTRYLDKTPARLKCDSVAMVMLLN